MCRVTSQVAWRRLLSAGRISVQMKGHNQERAWALGARSWAGQGPAAIWRPVAMLLAAQTNQPAQRSWGPGMLRCKGAYFAPSPPQHQLQMITTL